MSLVPDFEGSCYGDFEGSCYGDCLNHGGELPSISCM